MKILLFLLATVAFTQTPALPPSYVLGPDDQVVIHVLDSDEIGATPFRIDMRGYINAPLAGRLQAAGLTVDQLEAAVAARLKQHLQTPVVTVSLSEFGSQPVSVLGAVNNPGLHQIRRPQKVLYRRGLLRTSSKPRAGIRYRF